MASSREYGKHVENRKWSTDNTLEDRCAEFYEVETGIKVVIWMAGRKTYISKSMIWPRMNDETTQDVIKRMCEYYKIPDNARIENPPTHNYGTL